jgi:hypothetical protein
MNCTVYDSYSGVALVIEHPNFLSDFRRKKPMSLGFAFSFVGIPHGLNPKNCTDQWELERAV